MYICSSCLSVLDCFCFNASVFFQNSQVSSNVPYDKLGGNSNVTGSGRDLYPYNFISCWHFSAATQLRQCLYAMLQLTPCSTKRRTLWKQPVTCPYLCISHFELQVRIVNHAHNTRWGVRMRYEEYAIRYYQMLSDVIRCYQIHIRYYPLYHHKCYQKNMEIPSSASILDRFFWLRHDDVHTPQSWSPWWWRVLRKSCLSYHPQKPNTSSGAAIFHWRSREISIDIIWYPLVFGGKSIPNHFLEDCTKLYQHALMLMLFDVIYMVKIVWTEWTEFFSPHLCNGFNTFRHLKTFGHVFSRIDVVYASRVASCQQFWSRSWHRKSCILDVWRRSKMLLHRCPHGSATRFRRWSAKCQCWRLRDIQRH